MQTIDAVVGFMFLLDRRDVVLICKRRPAFQAGKLNGVGGKVEAGESPIEAMVREFREETGRDTALSVWEHFASVETPGWHVRFFRAFSDLIGLESKTDERVEVVPLSKLRSEATMRNLQWLVPLALDTSSYQLPIVVRETA